MKLSEHFTLGELTKTSYITSDGNIPSRVAIENLKRICEDWLEDLRYSYNTLYGQRGVTREGQSPCNSVAELPAHRGDSPCVSPDIPIVITSGYRSEEVNRMCGGAKRSNHLTGCAVDIRCYGPEHMIRMAGILLDIADGTKRDLAYSRVCSRSAESMPTSLCARSTADFDELILEQRGTTYWIHFAVRPKDNRRKILFDCR